MKNFYWCDKYFFLKCYWRDPFSDVLKIFFEFLRNIGEKLKVLLASSIEFMGYAKII